MKRKEYKKAIYATSTVVKLGKRARNLMSVDGRKGGKSISPELFTATLEEVLRKLNWDKLIDNSNIVYDTRITLHVLWKSNKLKNNFRNLIPLSNPRD